MPEDRSDFNPTYADQPGVPPHRDSATAIIIRSSDPVEHTVAKVRRQFNFQYSAKRKPILGPVFEGRFVIGRWLRLPQGDVYIVSDAATGCPISIAVSKAGALGLARLALAPERRATLIAYLDRVAELVAPPKSSVARIGRRRRAIFEKSEGKCSYCGVRLDLAGRWHVDHAMPKALGGSNDPVNLVAACAPCNHAKRDKTDVEFRALLKRIAPQAA